MSRKIHHYRTDPQPESKSKYSVVGASGHGVRTLWLHSNEIAGIILNNDETTRFRLARGIGHGRRDLAGYTNSWRCPGSSDR